MFIYINIEITRLIKPTLPKSVNLKNYEHYLVSYWGGKVFNTRTNNILNCWGNEHGYRRVRLTNGKHKTLMYVHRLVGLTWIQNPHNKEEINHLDKIRYNCNRPNLEWVTRQENMEHQYTYKVKNMAEGLEPEEFPEPIEAENVPF